MKKTKCLIICKSIHHNNTLKVAKVISEELNSDIKTPEEINNALINKYELIGFGSGIYDGKHHKSLFKLVDKLKIQKNKKAFVFSTATIRHKKMHDSLNQNIISKGFVIVDEFICKGFVDYSFLKYFFGGLNKGRPNKKDLEKAKEFAIKLKNTNLKT